MPGPTLEMEPVEPQSLKKLSFKSLKRALDLFSPIHGHFAPPDPESKKIQMSHKMHVEYSGIRNLSSQPTSEVHSAPQDQGHQASAPSNVLALPGTEDYRDHQQKGGAESALAVGPSVQPNVRHSGDTALRLETREGKDGGERKKIIESGGSDDGLPSKSTEVIGFVPGSSERLQMCGRVGNLICYAGGCIPFEEPEEPNNFQKTIQVISGHLGWVRSIAFDPSNTWFCTGSADRTIKIWDVGSGKLKLTLTRHIEQIRGLAVSNKHAYMFSTGDDKQVKCWDLEQNKVIRSYHGHLSGVYCLALHPTIDILLTGGRDSVCRFWDIRSKMQIHALSGHDNTVCSVFTRPTCKDPQVVTGSHDTTIKFWDLRHGEDGSLWFWDWKSGHNFQQAQTIVQPGSLDSEAGIYALSYDITGSRLVTCEADKTIKMLKEDENATPETHPLNFKPPKELR
ncbi:hypothetical protein HHK36_026523 [Tetracentron sinense]|uniref:Uncharacterized protein n=1 Tax=Tetracentron sinense TaxID=13715 RepID=A0A834YLI8_TETSI|nr:hypothetical protein HHK36_026523 [Tetracentron sinense]